MVDFGSEQGLSTFETAGIADAMSRIAKVRKRSYGPKDAVCGWSLHMHGQIQAKGSPFAPFTFNLYIPAQIPGKDEGPGQAKAMTFPFYLPALTDLGIALKNKSVVLRVYPRTVIRYFNA
jgi:hypothetical protein